MLKQIVLVTTADSTGGRQAELERLFDSVAAFRASCPDVPLTHHLLLQRCNNLEAARQALKVPHDVKARAIDRQLPLSVARNLMLDDLLQEADLGNAVVAFPDDDAWYPAGTLAHVFNRFVDDPRLDLWFCRYGSTPIFEPGAREENASLQRTLSFASSNTTFVRGSLLQDIGGYDEQLGLGTPSGSGEDTEFAMRAHLVARKSVYADAVMVGHRDNDPVIKARYYGGSLQAISRHAGRSWAGRRALSRKLAVGVALTVSGQLSAHKLVESWRALLGSNPSYQSKPIRPSAPRLP